MENRRKVKMEHTEGTKKAGASKSEFAGWYMLSRVRNELFGIAILGIFVFHIAQSILDTKVKAGRKYTFAWIYDLLVSSTGVELFVILSGVGLCFSFHKDGRIVEFYKRRLFRIVIPYLLFAFPFWIYVDVIIKKLKFSHTLKDLFFITLVRDGKRTLWYIFFIIGMYIIYPLLFNIFSYRTGREKSRKERRRLMAIATVMIVFCYVIVYVIKKKTPNLYNHTEIALLRVPEFIYGAWLGEKVYRKKMISVPDIILPVVGMILKMILVMDRADKKIDIERVFHGRLVAFLYGVALLLIFAMIFDLLRESGRLVILRKVISEIGKTSLELYLSHIMVRHVILLKFGAKGFVKRVFIYTVLSFALAFMMRFLYSFLRAKTGTLFLKRKRSNK